MGESPVVRGRGGKILGGCSYSTCTQAELPATRTSLMLDLNGTNVSGAGVQHLATDMPATITSWRCRPRWGDLSHDALGGDLRAEYQKGSDRKTALHEEQTS